MCCMNSDHKALVVFVEVIPGVLVFLSNKFWNKNHHLRDLPITSPDWLGAGQSAPSFCRQDVYPPG